jgi:hypothetical protein
LSAGVSGMLYNIVSNSIIDLTNILNDLLLNKEFTNYLEYNKKIASYTPIESIEDNILNIIREKR